MSSWPMIFDTVVKGLTGVAQVVTLMEKGRCCALQWTDKKNQDADLTLQSAVEGTSSSGRSSKVFKPGLQGLFRHDKVQSYTACRLTKE
ncbi:unnamed protein product [Fusarium graminearum]|nr:unnamed protein product [Fusarium graminearum]